MTLPLVALAAQNIKAPQLQDPAAKLIKGLKSLNLGEKVKPGQKVAITAGSRGVKDMDLVLRETVRFFKGLGADPFISPAMGSHGGATGPGQAELLAGLGISEKTMGCPVVSNMDVVDLGRCSLDQPVFTGRDFYEADHVVVVNRVKPHTSFRGKVESGLCKIMTIGMGKHQGARLAHQLFFRHGFEPVVMELAEVIMREVPILCGVALVQNYFEDTADLKVCTPDDFVETESALLKKARGLMGRIRFEDVDLLIIDWMGKDISGSGMDSNITGRIMNQVTKEPEVRQFRRIYVRDLTAASQGNALGIGTADFASVRITGKMDAAKTAVNCITASVPEKGRVPIAFDQDRLAIREALASCGVIDLARARVVWIKNTLELERMRISQALADEARAMDSISLLSDFEPMPFDDMGGLPFDSFTAPDVG